MLSQIMISFLTTILLKSYYNSFILDSTLLKLYYFLVSRWKRFIFHNKMKSYQNLILLFIVWKCYYLLIFENKFPSSFFLYLNLFFLLCFHFEMRKQLLRSQLIFLISFISYSHFKFFYLMNLSWL